LAGGEQQNSLRPRYGGGGSRFWQRAADVAIGCIPQPVGRGLSCRLWSGSPRAPPCRVCRPRAQTRPLAYPSSATRRRAARSSDRRRRRTRCTRATIQTSATGSRQSTARQHRAAPTQERAMRLLRRSVCISISLSSSLIVHARSTLRANQLLLRVHKCACGPGRGLGARSRARGSCLAAG
jgi:hypothetical protein